MYPTTSPPFLPWPRPEPLLIHHVRRLAKYLHPCSGTTRTRASAGIPGRALWVQATAAWSMLGLSREGRGVGGVVRWRAGDNVKEHAFGLVGVGWTW